MAGLRRLALILGFRGWATLAYALVVILAHDGALVIVDSLGPWEPWLDVVAVVFAVSVTGTALVREYRAPRKSRRGRSDPNPAPHADAGRDSFVHYPRAIGSIYTPGTPPRTTPCRLAGVAPRKRGQGRPSGRR